MVRTSSLTSETTEADRDSTRASIVARAGTVSRDWLAGHDWRRLDLLVSAAVKLVQAR